MKPWNKGMSSGIEIACETCGAVRKYTSYRLSKGKHHFCSIKCKGLFYSGIAGPMFGKHHTKEAKKKISITHTGNKYNLGLKRSKETRKKQSEFRMGKKYEDFMNPEAMERKKSQQSELMKKKIEEGTWNFPSKQESAKLKLRIKNKERAINNNPFRGKHHSAETLKKISRENSPHWRGGIAFEPYTSDFNFRFKEFIRERDNRCCLVCNAPEEALDRQLSVHHIDYDKNNSIPQNCVSLCRICHTSTNVNREHWKKFFQSLLTEKYSYIYENGVPVMELVAGRTEKEIYEILGKKYKEPELRGM